MKVFFVQIELFCKVSLSLLNMDISIKSVFVGVIAWKWKNNRMQEFHGYKNLDSHFPSLVLNQLSFYKPLPGAWHLLLDKISLLIKFAGNVFKYLK